MSNYHVTKRTNGWAYKKAGAEKAAKIVRTQFQAEKIARKSVEKSGGGELITHGRDGKIRSKDTIKPAKEPTPPHDTEN